MLLEYQAKALLSRYQLPLPVGQIIKDETIPFTPCMLKVQIARGGRGKAGGIVRANTVDEATTALHKLRSKSYYGLHPEAIYCEEPLEIARELYLALKFDRDTMQTLLIAHTHGGVEIESASTAATPLIQPLGQLDISRLAAYLELAEAEVRTIVTSLRTSYEREDMLLLEINPLVVTAASNLVCADAKIILDEAARFRHPDWPPKQTTANFAVIDLEGQIGTAANGAGLAMATTDALQAAELKPYNFYDVGGGLAGDEFVETLRQLAGAGLRAIVINIFGGITQCDEIARRIITARNEIPSLPRLFVRLSGTNSLEGQRLLHQANIAVFDSLEAITRELKS